MSVRIRRLGLAALVASAAFIVATGSAAPAAAQSPAPAPAITDWVGTWRGEFITDGPTGVMNLVIEHADGAWKIVNDMESAEVPPKSDVREWKVEGATFSFAQTFGEYDVSFRGTLEGTTIKGTLEAYQAGSLVGTGSYTLTRQ
jgi:hypothetical protein